MCLSSKKKGGKFIFGFLALMMAASLVFTFSRGAWIGFVLAIGIYILLKDKRLIIPGIVLAVLVVALVQVLVTELAICSVLNILNPL